MYIYIYFQNTYKKKHRFVTTRKLHLTTDKCDIKAKENFLGLKICIFL